MTLFITIPVIIALVEMVKQVFPGLAPRWFPLVALAVSAAAGGATFLLDASVLGLIGDVLVSALSAAGLYSATKALTEGAAVDPSA